MQLLYQAEPNFWMVLVLNVPKEILAKDGVDYTEYRAFELNDNIYRRVLMMSYERFRIEEGTFQMIVKDNSDNSREVLVEKLEEFFNKVWEMIYSIAHRTLLQNGLYYSYSLFFLVYIFTKIACWWYFRIYAFSSVFAIG